MKNYTTYYAGQKSFLTRLAALCMILSAVARIVFGGSADRGGVMVVVVRILLPIAANLIFALVLLLRGEKQLYVTRVPVVLLAIVFIDRITHLGMPVAMTVICVVLCILQTVLYCATYRGHFKSKLWVLVSWVSAPCIFAADAHFRELFTLMLTSDWAIVVADCLAVFGIILGIAASKAMPEYKEGDPYRLRPGDRIDGRRVRTRNPLDTAINYIMPYRNGATNSIEFNIEISNMERYIHQKRREGLKHFGITHVIIAAYVRAVAELPALNRFVAGQHTYNRFGIYVSMMAKREMELGAKEDVVKVRFEPTDTASDVYRRFDEELQRIRTEQDSVDLNKFIKLLNMIPGLFLKFVIWLVSTLDYFGYIPKFIEGFSPFHASVFITSMGSLGIPPIIHHLYDFGNVPTFCSFGAKKTVREIAADGSVVTRKYIDLIWNTDERICDGHYYSVVLKTIKSYLLHPDRLDLPPEEVKQDID